MARILIPTPLRQYADKQNTVELSGANVGEVLASLTGKFPDLKKHLFNDEGKLRSFVNVYLNDEDIRYLNKDATPVKDSDTLSIVPSIAGGMCEDMRLSAASLSSLGNAAESRMSGFAGKGVSSV